MMNNVTVKNVYEVSRTEAPNKCYVRASSCLGEIAYLDWPLETLSLKR